MISPWSSIGDWRTEDLFGTKNEESVQEEHLVMDTTSQIKKMLPDEETN